MSTDQNLDCNIQMAKAFFIELHLNPDVKTKYNIEDEDSTYIDFTYEINSKKHKVSCITVKKFKDDFYSAFKFESGDLKSIENIYNYTFNSTIDLGVYNLYDFDYKFNILDFISSGVLRLASDSENWRKLTYKVSAIIDDENIVVDIYMFNVKIKSLLFSDLSFKSIPFRIILSKDHLGDYNKFDLSKAHSALEKELSLVTGITNQSICFRYRNSRKNMPYSSIALKGISKMHLLVPAHEIFSNQMRNLGKIEPACEELGSIYNGIYKFCESKNIDFTDKLVQ
jgi:hypothetical protein